MLPHRPTLWLRWSLFYSAELPWGWENVTMLAALVEESSQELCDLYSKAVNLDVKTVLEGGHNNQVQKSTQYSWCSALEKHTIRHWLKPCVFSKALCKLDQRGWDVWDLHILLAVLSPSLKSAKIYKCPLSSLLSFLLCTHIFPLHYI